MSNLAINIRFRRIRYQMLQKDLAAKCGVRAEKICRIENGKSRPGKALLAKIAEVLNCDVEHLKKQFLENGEFDELDFYARLKYYRKLAGLSQQQLNKLLGRSINYTSYLERGLLPPPKGDTRLKLIKLLNIQGEEAGGERPYMAK